MILEEIKDKGWTKFTRLNKHSELDKLNNYAKSLEANLLKKLKDKKNKNIELEIFKSTSRALIKYSPKSIDLLFEVTQEILKKDPKFINHYISFPYLLFHLPQNIDEVGTLHNDTVKEAGKSITCWTPINNYKLDYSPVTLIEKTNNKFDQALFRILVKFFNDNFILKNYFKIFKKVNELKPEIYETFLWDADSIHVGNLNISNKTHYALTSKISERPHLTEPSIRISEFLQKYNENYYKDLDIEFDDLFNFINEINNVILDFFYNDTFGESLDKFIKALDKIKIKINNSKINDCISFAFSLIGYKQKDKRIALIQYFTSIYFNPKYLSSLQNVIIISKKTNMYCFINYIKKNILFKKEFQKRFLNKYKDILI